jgi:hypothetical protein
MSEVRERAGAVSGTVVAAGAVPELREADHAVCASGDLVNHHACVAVAAQQFAAAEGQLAVCRLAFGPRY